MKYVVTISMPIFGRPERTKRAIESIVYQDFIGWEAYLIGDGCPHFRKLLTEGDFLSEMMTYASNHGNRLVCMDFDKNTGGCGYMQTNYAIKKAQGKYLTFMANDDLILPDHLQNYVSAIEEAQTDMVYLDSWLDPISSVRVPVLAPSQIGHSEIIVKTSLARKAPKHSPRYGHDWEFIDYLVKHGTSSYVKPSRPTYHVMHIPNFGTKDVID